MFIRIGQSRYLNSNIMIYAMKKVLMECMDIYRSMVKINYSSKDFGR